MASLTTEQKIQTAFLQMLETTLFSKIKINDLAKKAGISRGTFYTHYDSIYDLLEDVENQLFEKIPGTSSNPKITDTDLVYESLIAKLAYIRQLAPTLKLLMGPNGDPYFQYQMGRFFLPIEQNYELFNLSATSQNGLTLLNEALNGARMSIIHWWIYHLEQVSTEQLARFLRDFIQRILTGK